MANHIPSGSGQPDSIFIGPDGNRAVLLLFFTSARLTVGGPMMVKWNQDEPEELSVEEDGLLSLKCHRLS